MPDTLLALLFAGLLIAWWPRTKVPALLAGNYTADERLAAFLVSLSRRYAARGFSRSRFRLTMR